MRAGTGRWRSHWPAAAAAAITLLLLGEGLVPGHVFFLRDLGMQFSPLLQEAHAGPDGGADLLPFWTHASTHGRPLLANPGFALLSPFVLAWAVLPHAAAFDLFLIAHALLAAAGMASLARVLGCSPAASLCAGVALGLGGGVVSAHDLWWALVALGWAPWVLVAAARVAEAPSPRRVALLALAMALQANGGMPEVVLSTLVVGVAIALGCDGRAPWRRVLRCAWTWGLAGAWAIALAAPQLVPAALHARHTLRAYGFTVDGLLYNSLDPRALPGLVLPRWGGHPLHRFVPGSYPGAAWTDTGTPYLMSHDCGLLVAALALLATAFALRGRLLHGRRALVLGLATAALLGILVALGRHLPAVAWLAGELAPLPFRYPVKALFATFLALPLLAGLGLDALVRRLRETPTARALGVAVALSAGLELLAAHVGYLPAAPVAALEEPPLARALKERAARLEVPDGQWLVHHERLPFGGWGPPAGTLEPTEAALHEWQRRMLMPPTGAPHGIRHGFDRVTDLLEDQRAFECARRLYATEGEEWARGLGRSGVLFVVSPGPELGDSTGSVLHRQFDLDDSLGLPPGSGFVYRNLAFQPRAQFVERGAAWIDALEEDHRGLTLRVRAARESTLVLREALGELDQWTATSGDGRPFALGRADGCFTTLVVPPGEWTLRIEHVPPGWHASVAASAIALAAALLCVSRRGRRAVASPATDQSA